MRYGHPSIAQPAPRPARARLRTHPARPALSAICRRDHGDGLRRSVPHLAAGCAGSRRCGWPRPITTTRPISSRWRARSKRSCTKLSFAPDVILASFHGIPKDYLIKGDPYYCHCAKTYRLLRERLKLDESKFMISFQSRFGSAEWLQPYTDATVNAARQGRSEEPRGRSRPASPRIAWRRSRRSRSRTQKSSISTAGRISPPCPVSTTASSGWM